MDWDSAVNVQIALIALLSALLAVLAAEVTRIRASVDEWQKTMNRMGETLLKAESHARKLKETEQDEQNAAARQQAQAPEAGGGAQPGTAPPPAEQPRRDPAGREERMDAPPASPPPPAPTAAAGQASGRGLEKLARELYQQWCDRGEPPYSRDGVDIGYLRYAGDQRTSELSPPMHVFSDDAQMGEFVRFSFPGSESGLAFPNPEAFFNARVHHILFPGLTADYLGNHHQLANTRPVSIQRQGDGLWQKAP